MSRRTLAGLGIACAALLVPLTGCTSAHPEAERPAQPTRSPEPDAAAGTAGPGGSAQPPVQKPPELDAGEALAGRQNVTSGNASFAFREGRKGDALIVAVRCRGAGVVKVAVRPVHVSFPLKCLTDEVSTVYNQVAVGGADRSGVVSVEAPSSVRWTMTIGRGAPEPGDTHGGSRVAPNSV
ncbi:hypothetical protein ABZ471_35975 [Streptomyces sp. NPDC005728]|uniref:hypothetical protein n=1 Tax=Streptomyces sp. NPDC005728 TaxID=3157054 RepID=UPI0033FE4E1A